MAADWVPAVTAGITALAALGGQAIAGWIQGRNQERIEASQRRQQAAEVLAEVMATLRNLAIGLLRLAGHAQIASRCAGSTGIPPAPWRSSASHEPANTPNPITPRPWTPGTRIPISHQRHAMGALFDIREHEMAETCRPVRGSR